MKTKPSANFSGEVLNATPPVISNQNVRLTKAFRHATEYPATSIGADLAKRNYIKYLVERYHRYREADASFGRTARFGYAVIFKNIEAKFGTPTYFVPESRFAELQDYLHGRINTTLVGKKNHARGLPNYKSFDEYVLEHMTSLEPAHA